MEFALLTFGLTRHSFFLQPLNVSPFKEEPEYTELQEVNCCGLSHPLYDLLLWQPDRLLYHLSSGNNNVPTS